ncbi:hypothetical protein, partial [Phormidium sp. CCY1219]|uniref:hypothetical protein n=1 Tax=Phormidium sp. CCY1219 TaxID=2886104 RepID=UPI002D1F638E
LVGLRLVSYLKSGARSPVSLERGADVLILLTCVLFQLWAIAGSFAVIPVVREGDRDRGLGWIETGDRW